MGRFSEMLSKVVNPDVRLNEQPDRIKPVLQTTANDWGPSPTGWYPNVNQETQGQVRNDYPVREPNGSSGGPLVPVEPMNGADKVDQHPFLQVAASWEPGPSWGNGRPDGGHDPLTDGLPQPTVRYTGIWYHPSSGDSRTRYMDVPDGRTFPANGSQDGMSWTYYQDLQSALAPYSVDPATYDPKHPERSTDMPDSFAALPPSPEHGWSTIPVAPGTLLDTKKAKQLIQQQYVTQNRLANSTYAGQTFSQQTKHVTNPAGTGDVPSWRPRG